MEAQILRSKTASAQGNLYGYSSRTLEESLICGGAAGLAALHGHRSAFTQAECTFLKDLARIEDYLANAIEISPRQISNASSFNCQIASNGIERASTSAILVGESE